MTALTDLLKDSAYKLSQFKPAQVAALEKAIEIRESAKKETPYVACLVRGKPIKLTPEEAIRQLYVMVLRDELGYPVGRMEVEHAVSFGREKKRADVCIFDKDKTTTPYILVELKKPKLKDGKEQLKSYCNARPTCCTSIRWITSAGTKKPATRNGPTSTAKAGSACASCAPARPATAISPSTC